MPSKGRNHIKTKGYLVMKNELNGLGRSLRWLGIASLTMVTLSGCIGSDNSDTLPVSEKSRPNIIVIAADDLGSDTWSVATPSTASDFPVNAPTPTLASLADQGVVFENGWAMPTCSTTRGARAMGLNPSTSGMGWVLSEQFTPYPEPDPATAELEFPPVMVDPNDPNLLQKLLQQGGYQTFKLGKWHEIQEAPTVSESLADVLAAGFDEFYGELGGFPAVYGGDETWIPATSISSLDQDGDGLGEPTREFLTSALASRAIELIDSTEESDQPYYLALDFIAPHWPYDVAPGPNPDEPIPDGMEASKFLRLNIKDHLEVILQVIAAFNDLAPGSPELAQIRADIALHGADAQSLALYPPAGTRAPNGDSARQRAAFKSLVSYLDLQLGRVLEHVNLSETVVIFTGDNGTQGMGSAAPGFDASVVESPFTPQESKGTLYRNGVEVPFLAVGAGVEQTGINSPALVNTTDIYATVLDIAGITQPDNTKLESFSFANVLNGGETDRTFNLAETYAATATVGGRWQGALFGPSGRTQSGLAVREGRVVADERFRLLVMPVTQPAFSGPMPVFSYVCTDAANPHPECLNPATGIYEKQYTMEFYDKQIGELIELPEGADFEDMPLTLDMMNREQQDAFDRLCARMNEVSERATYFQNGQSCDPDGSNLTGGV